jgi:hypothetical protein
VGTIQAKVVAQSQDWPKAVAAKSIGSRGRKWRMVHLDLDRSQ